MQIYVDFERNQSFPKSGFISLRFIRNLRISFSSNLRKKGRMSTGTSHIGMMAKMSVNVLFQHFGIKYLVLCHVNSALLFEALNKLTIIILSTIILSTKKNLFAALSYH
jgi:hypothetical protein